MSTPAADVGVGTRRASEDKKMNSAAGPSVVTRNRAQQAKIQTRAMATGRKQASASSQLLASKKKAMMKKRTCVDTVLRDHYQTAMDAKTLVRGATGLTTDPRMTEHRCLWDPNYPECPERLSSVIQRCEELGLISQCKPISSRAATEEEVNSLHSPLVHEILKGTRDSNNIELLEEVSSKYDAIYIHPSTHELALLAAGSTIDIVESVVKGEIQNGVAFIRPPGHHAMKAEPCGYCFYNNVALAAKHALDNLGVNRILIVDWDVHHGQATQQMFYNDPRVVYFSIHRYEHGSFWPNLRQSNFNYVGDGSGLGFNVNVPLNRTGMGDADYLAIWHQLLLPIAFEYQPELILVSAGYDAALGCPEGEMEVTPACYAHLTHMLLGVCARACVVLEGGYCLQSLAEGAALTLRTLLGHPVPRMQQLGEPSDSIQETILNCIYAHKPYWRCFAGQPTYSADNTVPNVSDAGKAKHKVEVRWEGDETRPDTFATRDCYPLQSHTFLEDVKRRLNHLRIVTDLSIPEHAVCYIYDEAMLKHKNIVEPDHVECPERIMRIHERHRDYELLSRTHRLTQRRATDEDILLVHTETHLARLKDLTNTKLRDLNAQKDKFDSVYFHPESYESAAVAAGCVLQTVEAVLSGRCGSGVCVVRPPGHHADDDMPSGFCLLNNAAIGARYATKFHGLKRVLLLDWDVHHGNGTQKIFESDPSVLYMSLHRYDNGSFFPHSKNADYTSVGTGRGEGFNVNVPWNKRGMGDTEYLAAFTNVVLPIAYEFDPELVIVSAGFDACVGDPLGGCKVSPECYGRLTHLLKGLAHGRVILCLEGGYNTTSIAYAMTMCTKALLGDPLPYVHEPKPTCHWSAIESINNVISVHKKYWKNLKFQIALPNEKVLDGPAPSRGLILTNIEEPDRLSISGYNTSSSTLNDSARSEQSNLSILESLHRSANAEELQDSMSKLHITKAKWERDSIDETKEKFETSDASISNLSINTSANSISEKKITRSGSESKSPRQNSLYETPKAKYEGENCGASEENDSSIEPHSRQTSIGNVTMNISSSSFCEKRVTRSSASKQSKSPEQQKQALSIDKTPKPICKDGNCGTDDENDTATIEKTETQSRQDSIGNVTMNTSSSSFCEKRVTRSSASKSKSPEKQKRADTLNVMSKPKCEGGNCDTDDEESGKKGKKTPPSKEAASTNKKENSNKNKKDTNATGSPPKNQTLVDYLAANMIALADEEMFAVIPLPGCPHLEMLYSIPENVRLEQGSKCISCDNTEENWVCLHCYVVACGRFVNGHMQTHFAELQHPLVLSLADLSVWCNVCNAYIDNPLLYDAKNLAHQAKFGEPMPWCYAADTIHMP